MKHSSWQPVVVEAYFPNTGCHGRTPMILFSDGNMWLPGADALHVASSTPGHFRYEFQLEAKPAAASLHIVARGAFVAHVNGQVTGHHEDWGAFDREEIGSPLRAGDNEITRPGARCCQGLLLPIEQRKWVFGSLWLYILRERKPVVLICRSRSHSVWREWCFFLPYHRRRNTLQHCGIRRSRSRRCQGLLLPTDQIKPHNVGLCPLMIYRAQPESAS